MRRIHFNHELFRRWPLWVRLAGLVLIALGAAVTCGNEQECSLNSDCFPGRFCSSANFCEFQCRTDNDCGSCGTCDLRFGVCLSSKPASFDALGPCCAPTSDSPVPKSPAGICLQPDGGTDASPSPTPADAGPPSDDGATE